MIGLLLGSLPAGLARLARSRDYGDLVNQHIARDRVRPLLRRSDPVRERAALDMECDGLLLVVHLVTAEMVDAPLDDRMVFLRCSLGPVVGRNLGQRGALAAGRASPASKSKAEIAVNAF